MDIGGWLRSLGLERYEAAFRENEIDETVLPSLTHETLNYSTKRSNRHFLRVMLSRSISSVSRRSVEARLLDSRAPLAGNRKVGHRTAQKH